MKKKEERKRERERGREGEREEGERALERGEREEKLFVLAVSKCSFRELQLTQRIFCVSSLFLSFSLSLFLSLSLSFSLFSLSDDEVSPKKKEEEKSSERLKSEKVCSYCDSKTILHNLQDLILKDTFTEFYVSS